MIDTREHVLALVRLEQELQEQKEREAALTVVWLAERAHCDPKECLDMLGLQAVAG